MQKIDDNNIKLIESIHRYELSDDPEFEFTSCTSFVKYFFEPFDKIGIANKLTDSHPNYLHLTSRELVEEWDQTAVEGTFIHSEIENYINHKTEPTHPKSKTAVKWLKEYILEIERYDIFPEVIVYSKELELAGTIDLLVYDKLKRTYKIVDWKTNKKIDLRSFNSRMGNHKATAELMDCNFYHYSIQLSLYRLILEEYYGLEITGTAISHILEDDVQIYTTQYHKNEVMEMLKADRSSLKQKAEDCLTKEYI